jgi:hypothetical protein
LEENLMPLCKRLVLKHSIEINTTPKKIWDFFKNIEENYTKWHPKDHLKFKWISGKPLDLGSSLYSEQYVFGKIQKYNGYISDVTHNKRIAFRFRYPVSLITPGIEWLIKSKGKKSIFTAITYIRAGHFYKKIFRKGMRNLIKEHNRHVNEEGEILKKLLEE